MTKNLKFLSEGADSDSRALPVEECARLYDYCDEESSDATELTLEEIGRELQDDYELTSVLGRGGMGMVFSGRDLARDCPVAIKVLALDDWSNPTFAKRFERESEVMAGLDHPNIVRTERARKSASGYYFYAMDLIEGNDLSERLRHSTRPSIGESIRILSQICAGVTFAHQAGVVHRDLKPSNILLENNNRVLVADFGLAYMKDSGEAPRLTSTNVAVGTVEFSSPEQLSGGPVTAASDVYSIGVIAYELLTGSLPRGAFEDPSRLCDTVDPAFDEVIMRALKPSINERYPTVEKFRDDLIHAHETALLAGSAEILGADQAKVLEDFYEEAMERVPPEVRHFVEDHLLTSSGYRESFPIEEAVQIEGVTREALEVLESRRLLRLIERAGVERVELRQARLTGIVQASRDQRRSENAAIEAEEREQQLKSRMQRRVAIGILALTALALIVWGAKRNEDAKRLAESAASAKEHARELLDLAATDLLEWLLPLGRLDLLDRFHIAIDRTLSSEIIAQDDPAVQSLKAKLLNAVAEVDFAKGKSRRAEEAAASALELALKGESQDEVMKAILIQAKAQTETGRSPAAIRLIQQWLPKAEEPRWQAHMIGQLGLAQQGSNQRKDALASSLLAIEHWEQLRHLDEAPREIANNYVLAGELAAREADEALAKTCFAKARTALEDLTSASKEDYRSHIDLIHCLHREADALYYLKEHEAAHGLGLDALDDARVLGVRDENNLLWQHVHAEALVWCGIFKSRLGESQVAINMMLDGKQRLVKLVEIDSGMENWQWDLIGTLQQTASIYRHQGNDAEAQKLTDQAIAQMEDLLASGVTTDKLYAFAEVLKNASLTQPSTGRHLYEFWSSWSQRCRSEYTTTEDTRWLFPVMAAEIARAETIALQGEQSAAIEQLDSALAAGRNFFRHCDEEHYPSAQRSWRADLLQRILRTCTTLEPDPSPFSPNLYQLLLAAQELLYEQAGQSDGCALHDHEYLMMFRCYLEHRGSAKDEAPQS